jgi:hypothetical protein
VKNEAKSLLAAGHDHVSRVLALLGAARAAAAAAEWRPDPGASLGLELVVTTPSAPPSDATNYLGGVGDVLEDESRRGDLAHLGPLGAVALYANDRMLHEVTYRWEPAANTGYRVRLWVR